MNEKNDMREDCFLLADRDTVFFCTVYTSHRGMIMHIHKSRPSSMSKDDSWRVNSWPISKHTTFKAAMRKDRIMQAVMRLIVFEIGTCWKSQSYSLGARDARQKRQHSLLCKIENGFTANLPAKLDLIWAATAYIHESEQYELEWINHSINKRMNKQSRSSTLRRAPWSNKYGDGGALL